MYTNNAEMQLTDEHYAKMCDGQQSIPTRCQKLIHMVWWNANVRSSGILRGHWKITVFENQNDKEMFWL